MSTPRGAEHSGTSPLCRIQVLPGPAQGGTQGPGPAVPQLELAELRAQEPGEHSDFFFHTLT